MVPEPTWSLPEDWPPPRATAPPLSAAAAAAAAGGGAAAELRAALGLGGARGKADALTTPGATSAAAVPHAELLGVAS